MAARRRTRTARRRKKASRRQRSREPSWWDRWHAWILTAGALAGAVAAILGLPSVIGDLRPDPDPADRASIRMFVTAPVRLSEHKTRISESLPVDRLSRVAHGAVEAPPVALGPVRLVAVGGSSEGPEVTTTGSEPVTDPGTGVQSEPVPEEQPTSPQQPVPGEKPTSPQESVTTPEPSATEAPLPGATGRVQVEFYSRTEFARSAATRFLEKTGWGDRRPTEGCEEEPCSTIMTLASQMPVNPEGSESSAEDVADRLAAFFANVRSANPRRSDRPTTPEPLGASVNANIELVGLSGEEVDLSWSIFRQGDGVPLFGRWLEDIPVYRLRPGTDDDTTSIPLWVPLPAEPGPYTIRLTVSLDDVPLASEGSELIE